jgi:glucose/arabinose dehydrogenase
VLAAGVALAVLLATFASCLPPGFTTDVVISGLDQPMAVRFSPDGRVFVAEKRGVVKVYDGLGDTTATVLLDLRTQVYNQHDRGLMSIALAPDFPNDPHLYVLYVLDAPIGGTPPRWGSPGQDADPCPNPPGETQDGCVSSSRLSRFVVDGSEVGPEQILIEDWCAQFPSHATGDLAFGPDGYLYASAGDGASFNYADYGQAGNPRNPCGDPPAGVGGFQTIPTAEGGALRSQDYLTPGDPQSLDGSIIRVDPATGEGAPGNPFALSADANRRRIIGQGMRNPFRFAFQPATGELYFGDVGWSGFEEINRLRNPIDGTLDNFGWPCLEGDVAGGYDIGLDLCGQIYSGAVPTVRPHFAYRHGEAMRDGDACRTDTGSAISGLAFYPGGAYPASYDGALFFADYSRQCIWVMTRGADGSPKPTSRARFHGPDIFPVDLQIGPNNDVFYVDIVQGAVVRIR